MPTILIGLLIVITAASVLFLVLVTRLSVEDADLWLRPITGLLLLFTFVVGGAMLFTGYVVVDKLGIRVAEAQKEASNAKRRADEEAVKRAELEAVLAPRQLEQGQTAENLKPFAPIETSIEVVNDFEARRMAGQIVLMLQMAGWKPVGPKVVQKDEDFFGWVGIKVEASIGYIPEGDRAPNAAEALVAQLLANNIKAERTGPTSRHTPKLPLNMLIVRVGLKPPVPSESTKRLNEMLDREREEFERGFKAAQERARKAGEAAYAENSPKP